MRKVLAMMRQRFADLNCNDENVEDFENSWFISMYGSSEESPFFKQPHKNVLLLQVDDIDKEHEDLILFTKDQAQQVFEFFKKLGDDFSLIIHCGAGVSRSGAIAEFARVFFNLNYDEFKNDNPHILPNIHIVQTLRDQYLLESLEKGE